MAKSQGSGRGSASGLSAGGDATPVCGQAVVFKYSGTKVASAGKRSAVQEALESGWAATGMGEEKRLLSSFAPIWVSGERGCDDLQGIEVRVKLLGDAVQESESSSHQDQFHRDVPNAPSQLLPDLHSI